MKLAVSTLACPDWPLRRIIDQCASAGIRGIDFRGVASQIDITRLPQFTIDLHETLTVLGEKNLHLPCYNLSATLLRSEATAVAKAMAEVRRYARLARVTRTRYLRLFVGTKPPDMPTEPAVDIVRTHLASAVRIAQEHECQILVESHDDWATADALRPLLDGYRPEQVGVLWDFEHSWRAGEAPAETVGRLGTFIRHVHVKDSKKDFVDGRTVPTLLGDGELPIEAALSALQSIGYNGWYVLETEKRWRPGAPEPEESIGQFVRYMLDNEVGGRLSRSGTERLWRGK